MTRPYLEWIDQEITRHQTEIARLTVARGVIEEVSEKVRPQKLLPKPVKRRGMLIKGKTRDLCSAALETLGRPAHPREVAGVVCAEHPEITEKAIWNALYNARRTGAIMRSDNGLYHLPKPEQAAA